MFIQNSTQNEIFYGITSPGFADCGNIAASAKQDVGYNNKPNVTVSITPAGTTAFAINIPKTGIHNSVTIGMFFQ